MIDKAQYLQLCRLALTMNWVVLVHLISSLSLSLATYNNENCQVSSWNKERLKSNVDGIF